jgi:SAM-dependent methyltransferase
VNCDVHARDSGSQAGLAPSAWVCRFAPLIRGGGRVLDLACGSGRHVRWLAQNGWQVEAVDRDAEALAALTELPGVHVRAADLESGPWPYTGERFEGIVVANYLHRPLLPRLVAALAAAGVLIYETFARGNERYGRPCNPQFLLAPGELLQAASGLRVIAYEDVYVDAPKPALVQRICAINAERVARW